MNELIIFIAYHFDMQLFGTLFSRMISFFEQILNNLRKDMYEKNRESSWYISGILLY